MDTNPPVKHEYVTTRKHGDYPVGTKCLAWRDLEVGRSFIYLQFEDETVQLPGEYWYLSGIEERPWSWMDSISEGIARQIDEEILGF